MPVTKEKYLLVYSRLERILARQPSGWGLRNKPRDLHPLVMGVLRNSVRIAPIKVDRDVIAQARKDTRWLPDYRNKSSQHGFLERIGFRWIQKHFGSDAAGERYGHGSRVDVECKKNRLVIECGNTGAIIPVTMLTYEPDWRFFHIPFQRSVERWQIFGDCSSAVYMFEFTGTVLSEDSDDDTDQ